MIDPEPGNAPDIFVSPRADLMSRRMAPSRFLDYFRLFDVPHRCVADPFDLGESPVYPLNLGSITRSSQRLSQQRKEPFNVYDAFDPVAAREVQRRGGYFLLDLSVESFFSNDDTVAGLHEGVNAHALDPSLVALLNCNLRSVGAYDSAKARLGLPDGPVVLPFHGCFWTLVGRNRARGDSELMGRLQSAEATLSGKRREKKYLSLNGRVRPHRVHTLLWLLDRGHLNAGLVSLIDTSDEAFRRTQAAITRLQFPDASRLSGLMPQLAALLPLTVDVAQESYKDRAAYKAVLPWVSPDPGIYDAAYFSIVIDTSFGDDWLLLTPIAFKSFMNLSPFLYFGNPGALAEMRRLGFQTFSPLINEAYDDEAGYQGRMSALFSELERLLAMPTAQLHELYCELWPRVSHNYWHLYRHAKDQFEHDFRDRVAKPLRLNM